MTDIVERLRYCGEELNGHYVHAAIFDEAADEIERLRDEAEMDNLLQKTADASAKIARLLALEEAAQVAAAYSLEGEEIAAAIRALKGGE